MNSTKKPVYDRYDEICNILDYAAHIGKVFPASFCQNLLEQIETYAQWSASLPQMKAELMETRMMFGEMIAYLHTLPFRSKAEREARTALLERAERILYRDQNDARATEPSESAG